MNRRKSFSFVVDVEMEFCQIGPTISRTILTTCNYLHCSHLKKAKTERERERERERSKTDNESHLIILCMATKILVTMIKNRQKY